MMKRNPTPEQYQALQKAFDYYNTHLFDGGLPQCLITLQRESRNAGYFSENRFTNGEGAVIDEIAVNPAYFLSHGPLEAMQTLVHEMCHQWQYAHGKPSRRTYHNRQWADKMESLGLMPSSTGAPGGKRTGQSVADYPIEGGRFLTVTEALFAMEFKIPWADRFTPSGTIALASDSNNGKPIALLADGPLPPQGQRGPGKVKYSHQCEAAGKINVWGKPDLEIACALCGELMMASQS